MLGMRTKNIKTAKNTQDSSQSGVGKVDEVLFSDCFKNKSLGDMEGGEEKEWNGTEWNGKGMGEGKRK